jgi:hypothetical protein
MHDSSPGAATSQRVTWKPNSLQAMFPEAPALAEPKDTLPLRKHIFDWLGFYSFVLRLGREERKMLTPKALANHEKNQHEFRTTYTTPSYHHLQQDVFLALKRLLGKSIMVSCCCCVTSSTKSPRRHPVAILTSGTSCWRPFPLVHPK